MIIRNFMLAFFVFGTVIASETEHRFQANASLFMLANISEESPEYGHLDLAVRVSEHGYLGLEFITWSYSAPLGIPYGDDFENPNHKYPGSVRGLGAGLTYQHFIGTSWFVKIHTTPLLQTYTDNKGQKLQQGFQLFMATRLGYRWSWMNDKFFFEPSLAATSWPINTNLPKEFQTVDDKWPKYFLFEPGLNVGFRF